MDSINIKTTIIIKFAYPIVHYNNNNNIYNNRRLGGGESTSNIPRVNAANKSCAVCGSQLHMTSKVYNTKLNITHKIIIIKL